MVRTTKRFLLLMPLLLVAVGCNFQRRAQNPFPGVFRVVVAPFNDKTGGAAGLDTFEMTRIFASEVQRVPTFEVVPVEEVIQVIGPNLTFPTNQPELAFALARAVHAQAVIVGDVVQYEAYYPPTVTLHCEMYAMVTGKSEAVVLSEPIPVASPLALPAGIMHGCEKLKCKLKGKCGCERLKYRSLDTGTPCPDGCPVPCDECAPGMIESPEFVPSEGTLSRHRATDIRMASASGQEPGGVRTAQATTQDAPAGEKTEQEPQGPTTVAVTGSAAETRAGIYPGYQVSVASSPVALPVVEPWVVRHTRVFDGSNGGTVKKLKEYYFFRTDLRGGAWEGYALRMDDYNKFCCNRMLYEMLAAAGGEWVPLRGIAIPQPWQPWPWQ
ncbi:hypothetical protein Pan216_14710 [Planctomycetes bacterium Pan216]|uniref:Curli production assembly/transport component CsgG n=1 Tax=Kolteria novifilia TaxID=2527975 RepID=A0A518B0W9_9BACT|nr:hypothetical protein Pan216_14710 [Planctomycetes bacterium Pan216]